MSDSGTRPTQMSPAEQEELKKLARRMILHDPLLALKLRTGRNLSLAEAEELARKYRVQVGIVTAAIGLFTAGYCAAKAFEKGSLWVPGRLGRGS